MLTKKQIILNNLFSSDPNRKLVILEKKTEKKEKVEKEKSDRKTQSVTEKKLSEKAFVEYYQNFLTEEEEKELFDHLLSHIEWEQGVYNGHTLPRLLWSMHDKASSTELYSGKKDETKPDGEKKVDEKKEEEKKGKDFKYKEYTGIKKHGEWTDQVRKIKDKIEAKFPERPKIKYCEINRYRDGKNYIGYHSDRELLAGNFIHSLSLGCTRTFILKKKGSHFYSAEVGASINSDKDEEDEKKDNKEKKVFIEEKVQGETHYKIKLAPASLLVMNYEAGNKEFLHCLDKEPSVTEERINITFR
jgi:alkylated DNA repair dioxygenase AlkB